MVVLRGLYCSALLLTATTALGGVGTRQLQAQTFVQIAELSPAHTIGPRITQTVALNELNRQLFAALTAKTTFIDAIASPPTAYEFSSDAIWNRILFGEKDEYIKPFTNDGSSTFILRGPRGLDISATRTLFIADQMNGRVVLARFNAATKSLTQIAAVEGDADLGGVVDVAWDGAVAPLTTDNFFALDGAGRVSFWTWSGSGLPAKQWVYGTYGYGAGQFNGPNGICVGHAVGEGGGSVFTTTFYVADTWNKRVVQLQRLHPPLAVAWVRSVALPDSGVPADCTVDHFGNVIIADARNSRLLKYTMNLAFLSQYGSYGVGSQNNTFAHPNGVHVPFGTKRAADGQLIWYGEGRVLTAEEWSAASGAREHYLGLELSRTSGPNSADGVATYGYKVTDHGHHTVMVKDANNVIVRRLRLETTLMPSGAHSVAWDGKKDDGSFVPPGYYWFSIHVYSDYGCASQSWCNKFLSSGTFWFEPVATCEPVAAAPADRTARGVMMAP